VDYQFKEDFEYKWKEGTIRGWEQKEEENKSKELHCAVCQKYFTNENVYVVFISFLIRLI
jgi:hypothetical protein